MRLGQQRQTAHERAVKTVERARIDAMLQRMLDMEIAILKRVQHAHIVELLEVCETPQEIHLVFELCRGGSLAALVRSRLHLHARKQQQRRRRRNKGLMN